MATEVKLPRLGQGMESGTIVRWLKAEGDAVKKSEPLYELDTDKVTQEVESEVEGVLLTIVVKEGEVEVGTTIATIEAAGGDAAAPAAEQPAEAEQPKEAEQAPAELRPEATPTAPAPQAAPQPAAAAPAKGNGSAEASVAVPSGGRIKASPLARR